ncbi:MAG TPA: histidine--tRNA ligase [Candidatus Obscuribacterales bacterium]
MTETNTFNVAPARGMRDLLPEETELRDWATQVIFSTYQQFGFARIETPAMEHLSLLKSGEGGENLQLIFEVLKRGEKLDRVLEQKEINKRELADLGLRFDLTVPLVRFFCSNQANLLYPLKAIQIGSVWRAESPQAGRFRQFTQCDIDILGIKSEIAEMELLTASSEAMLGLGFTDFTIRINDRRLLSALVQSCGFKGRHDAIFIAIDKLDKIGLDCVVRELSKITADQESVRKLHEVLKRCGNGVTVKEYMTILEKELDAQVLSAQGRDGSSSSGDDNSLKDEDPFAPLESVIAALERSSRGRYHVAFDPTLVRGMGYYTGQIFEISCPGYSYSMGGGGRYDRMVAKFSGRDVPACGYSIGFERVLGALQDRGFKPPSGREKLALIYETDRDDPTLVMEAAQHLREKGFAVSTQPKKKDMRKQLDTLVEHSFSKFASFRGDPHNLEIKDLKR